MLKMVEKYWKIMENNGKMVEKGGIKKVGLYHLNIKRTLNSLFFTHSHPRIDLTS